MNDATPSVAWLNGELVAWEDCRLHARSPGGFWGANVFEGLRGYWDAEEGGHRVFRLADHLGRLRRSLKALHLDCRFDDADLTGAVQDVLLRNDFDGVDVHIVVVVYVEAVSHDALDPSERTGAHVTALAVPRSPLYETGCRVGVSSWRRISDDVMPPRIKAGANYHNGRLAHHEAARHGHDTALLLNRHGTVAEAPGSCVVMVDHGQLVTPPGTCGALDSLTVDSVETLAREHLGMELVRRPIDRTELQLADEAFLAGTLVELQPIVALDHTPLGTGHPGPVTRQLQHHYERAVRTGIGTAAAGSPLVVPNLVVA